MTSGLIGFMDVQRRLLIQGLAGCGVLAAFPQLATADPQLLLPFGNMPAPGSIRQVLSAGAPADMLLLALAPQLLTGFSSFDLRQGAPWLAPSIRNLPKLGRLAGRASTLSLEQLLALKPDLIIDCGNISDTFRSVAQRTVAQTGIPYLLVSGKLADSPAQLKQTGAVLGVDSQAAQLAATAEQILSDARTFAASTGKNLSFYAARGARGLETGLTGSLHTEAIELLGLRNVAGDSDRKGLAQVSLEQLLLWQPDLIITQDEATWQYIRQSPQWQGIQAVKQQQVLLYRRFPFGWLDAPPGVNRLLGLRRLQAHLDSGLRPAFKAEMQQFFRQFFHSTLSDEDYQTLVTAI
ncbi:ABC transporter substrate-binding protein [Shewanella dokdonensis]|uniref:ABC transporter substrate-binding protein n=1 Tax=Shewanella dokdonensis TaxID=712036 RepID=A0ABX8DDE3_9GAMM|nr:ABC transporter substrate-binding protein [Shewanella dokdonensis]MCL1074766.1 ABC transporter substrate-binding protein [Shewanella dokdonensis]QVK22251.1 ABC transporter substrate-binding protein [Shewanella dokdonensis]